MRNRRYVNQRELRVIGLSRSGTHAVINWLLAQVEGRYCFLNCAEPKSNPFLTARPLDSGLPYQSNYGGFDLAREQGGRFSHKDILIHGYEDCFLSMVCGKAFERRHDEFVGASAERLDVLILRDPYNLFASRKKAGIDRDASPEEFEVSTWGTIARIWRQHARAFIRERRYSAQPLVTVSYNRWARDPAYRAALAERLGLQFNDAGFRHVPAVASGSSFDGVRYHGRPESMKVLERWRHFQHDSHFWNLFEDEMVKLSERIFGPIAPLPPGEEVKPV